MKEEARAFNEALRVAHLQALDVTRIEDRTVFEALAELAAHLCDAPMALVSLVGQERQWCLAAHGWNGPRESGRNDMLCNHAVRQQHLLEIPDTLLDERFVDCKIVSATPHIRFYAGMPIRAGEQLQLGAVCVLDTRPRQLNQLQRSALGILSEVAMAMLEAHRHGRAGRATVALADRSFTEIYIVDGVTLELLYVSPGACEHLGYAPGELAELRADLVSDAYAVAALARLGEHEPGAGYQVMEVTHTRADGSRYRQEMRMQIAPERNGAIWMSVLADLATRKRDEMRLLRTQRFHEVFARTNHAIIHSHSAKEIFDRICDVAVSVGMCDATWIGLLDEAREIVPTASAGVALERVREVRYRLDDPVIRSHSVVVQAIVEGKPCLRNDYLPTASPDWLATMRGRGIRSVGAFPLYREGRIVGIFAIGDAQAAYFNDELSALLAELANSISFFLDTEVHEQARRAAERVVLEGELRYRTLVDLSPDSIFIYQGGNIRFINRAGRRMFGAPDGDMMENVPYRRLVHPDDWAASEPRIARIEAGFANPPLVMRGLRFDGTEFNMETSSSPLNHDGGNACMVVARDVTQQVRRERLMAEQANILECAARGEPLPDLLDRICRLARQQANDSMTAIQLLSDDGKRLHVAASCGLPAAFRAAIEGVAIGPDAGACGSAAFHGATAVVQDMRLDPRCAGCRGAALAHGIVACWSVPVFATDGHVVGVFSFWMMEARAPLEEELGVVGMLAGIAAVVIERDRTFRTLLSTQQKLLEAQRLARLGDWSMDISGENFSGSDLALEMLGLPKRARGYTAVALFNVIHPLDRRRLHEVHETVLAGQCDNFSIEFRLLRADGSVCHVESRGVVVFDADGRPARYTGVLQDITERKIAEQALVLNKRALESASSGIVISDARALDMPVIFVNDAFQRMTGYSSAEILGRNCRFMQGEETGQVGLGVIRAAVRENREGHAVIRNFRKDGTAFWLDLRIAPVRDADGTVTHFIGSQTDVSDAIRYEKELAFQASHDALTNLPNRSLLEDRLEQVISYAARRQRMVGVVFVDLDHFKSVNDTLGHNIGDRLLQTVAERFVASVREGDTVSRLGGDEFVVVCPDIEGPGDLDEVIARMFGNLRRALLIDSHEISIDASMGIALYPKDGQSAGELLKCADMAMYRSKESGRGMNQFYTQEMGVKVSQRRKTEQELRLALERNEFTLHYQPKASARSGEISGMEALIRWQHPVRGLVMPMEFIQIAEECNLIVPIGAWVMQQACRQNQAWRDAGLSDFPVSVNASMAQFRHTDFVGAVMQALNETGLPPHMLELEITESLAIESPELFIAALERIKAIGVRIAIDDFGTGYSSLSYIKRFPIDVLKIDRSFVRDITRDADDAAICRTIINLAHNLKLSVVAEGVETESQATYLRRHQCDALQGYLLCRPESAADMTARLRQNRRLLPLFDDSEKVRKSLLLLDDEEALLQSMTNLLEPEGYHVLAARTPATALRLLAEHDVAVIIADQHMAEMSGIEFLRLAKDIHPESVRMILSGRVDLESLPEAINRGAIYKFMVKPLPAAALLAVVRDAFGQHEMLVEGRQLRLHAGEPDRVLGA